MNSILIGMMIIFFNEDIKVDIGDEYIKYTNNISSYSDVFKNSDKQLYCLSEVIYYESRGDNLLGRKAVADVVLNRVDSDVFPNTICDVVYEKRQFSWSNSKYKITELDAWDNAKELAYIKFYNHYSGKRIDVTDGSTFFSTGYHHKGTKLVGKIGKYHVFFKL